MFLVRMTSGEVRIVSASQLDAMDESKIVSVCEFVNGLGWVA